jgi:hypothetical protein
MTGRIKKGIVRQKSIKRKAINISEGQVNGNELVIAQDLLKTGVSKEIVEEYLNRKIKK